MLANADAPFKPLPPVFEVPKFNEGTTVVCVSCDQPFEFPGHEKAFKDLLSNPYVSELRKAMYWQDTYHQFESKAHYDNCDFDGATNYIDELLQEVGKHASDAQHSHDMSDDIAAKKITVNAFFSLGQALHAIQDFYAHSNYVELKAKTAKNFDEIPLIHPWTESGKIHISELRKKGLVSGVVSWGVPKKCEKGTLSHKQLSKDTNKTLSGKEKLPSLENNLQYDVALYLARETSKNLIIYALKTWPILKTMNGANVAFDTLIEKRKEI